MSIALAEIGLDDWSDHPFVMRLRRYMPLGRSDLDHLCGLIESELAVEKRRDLVVDGYEYRKLCFVAEGFGARYKLLRNGKRQILNVILPGDVIGLPGGFLDRASYSVIALTEMRIHVCPIEAYVQLCYRRPQFGLALSWLAVHEAALYAERVVDTGRRTPPERLAHFLLELHARLAAVRRAEPAAFDLPFSQEVLGDTLGLSVPHLNRMMSQLRFEGLIKVADRRVEFPDLAAIRVRAQFQPLNLTRIPALA
ncbi:MAG TPA: Crp/Fnr family transcriptional regulator [Xanthobacteraceae bacterium]|nr:Crp/Fnr family transcriptional regulator [Xanthobacteraceae bacterium]